MTPHVIAYRSLELLLGTHTFQFNCFFEDFNCVFTQIHCLSRVLALHSPYLVMMMHVHCMRQASYFMVRASVLQQVHLLPVRTHKPFNNTVYFVTIFVFGPKCLFILSSDFCFFFRTILYLPYTTILIMLGILWSCSPPQFFCPINLQVFSN